MSCFHVQNSKPNQFLAYIASPMSLNHFHMTTFFVMDCIKTPLKQWVVVPFACYHLSHQLNNWVDLLLLCQKGDRFNFRICNCTFLWKLLPKNITLSYISRNKGICLSIYVLNVVLFILDLWCFFLPFSAPCKTVTHHKKFLAEFHTDIVQTTMNSENM